MGLPVGLQGGLPADPAEVRLARKHQVTFQAARTSVATAAAPRAPLVVVDHPEEAPSSDLLVRTCVAAGVPLVPSAAGVPEDHEAESCEGQALGDGWDRVRKVT